MANCCPSKKDRFILRWNPVRHYSDLHLGSEHMMTKGSLRIKPGPRT